MLRLFLFVFACTAVFVAPSVRDAHAQTYPFPAPSGGDPYYRNPQSSAQAGQRPANGLPISNPVDPRQRPGGQPSPQGAERPLAPQRSRPDLYEPAQIIARVGDQPIILGDLLGQVNQMLEPYVGQMSELELENQRTLLIKKLLEVKIDQKLMYLAFLREFPDASKLPEVEENLSNAFNEKQLPELLKKAKLNTPGEFDAYLRRYGSSLEKSKQSFIEQVMAFQIRSRHIDEDPEITHAEMLDDFQLNIKQYEIPAKVRWEQLTALADKFSDRRQARNAVASMGNEVLNGAPFHHVARRHSQGFRANQGGYHDWTSQGSLASDILDRQLFQLPIGELSQIIEDEQGFHIVRVIDRQPASYEPFEDAQVEIKKKLRKQKVDKQSEEYVAELRKSAPIWTIFDEEDAQ